MNLLREIDPEAYARDRFRHFISHCLSEFGGNLVEKCKYEIAQRTGIRFSFHNGVNWDINTVTFAMECDSRIETAQNIIWAILERHQRSVTAPAIKNKIFSAKPIKLKENKAQERAPRKVVF
jgi:hypothetical protein